MLVLADSLFKTPNSGKDIATDGDGHLVSQKYRLNSATVFDSGHH